MTAAGGMMGEGELVVGGLSQTLVHLQQVCCQQRTVRPMRLTELLHKPSPLSFAVSKSVPDRIAGSGQAFFWPQMCVRGGPNIQVSVQVPTTGHHKPAGSPARV